MVANSESDGHDFQLRIQPRAGFTNRLLTRSLVGATQLRAFVEGPYGHGFDLRDFGTVALFASGIGIVGHLAHIQELVHDYRQSETKTRDLLLVWHVDNKYQLDLVWEFMNNILRRDDLPAAAMHQDTRALSGSGKIDRYLGGSSTNESPGVRPAPHGENASVIIDVYIYGDYEILDQTGHTVPYKRAGSRIAEMKGKPDVRQITSDVIKTGGGRLAICGKLSDLLSLH
ncbi:ferric-chelate reductase [Pyrenophora seminiperda CCB06]|uniref:Ferric-chelate reductase n=1 Tax=Pyrenophora seminiperda CCB06 TaxID=1302712 RepID=A0A3M7MHQ8_9PLEO|nr:ferric-chelate reductase [Pyrenophora seminiperda CCB06]